VLIAAGLAIESVAPSWIVFVAGAGIAATGTGSVDAVVNSAVMDLSVAGSGSGLSRLHLFYSIGALGAPLVIGTLVGLGIEWRLLVAASGAVALLLALPLRVVGGVPARAASPGRPASARAVDGPGLRLPLAVLGAAIACYVATELGVSSWLVAFLAAEPMSVATLGLGLFWVGHASGRLAAARFADRFAPVRFTVACAIAGAVAILAAVLGPAGPPRIALFAAAGFALGPIWPMIMAVGGALFPHRAAAVSGLLTAAGVAGSVVYPPLMGLVSEVAGLGIGMVGAAILVAASGAAVIVADRAARRPAARPQVDVARGTSPPSP
jgi:fucose permease